MIFRPCSNSNIGPILLPWPQSSPSNATPAQRVLFDKVVQRQLGALILGLNPMSAGASLSLLPLPGLPSPCPALPAWLPIWLAVAKTKCLPFYYCWLLDNTLLGAVYLSLLFLKQNNPAKMNSDKLSRCIVNFTKELSWRGFSQSQSHSSVWLLSPADEKWCWRERWIRLCCNNYVLTSPWHNIVHQIWLFIPFQYHASFRRPKIYELSPLFSFFFFVSCKNIYGK